MGDALCQHLGWGTLSANTCSIIGIQGGVSKSTRGLHVSEDMMGGLNHSLRGGGIKFTDTVSCGKGRDMGFNR